MKYISRHGLPFVKTNKPVLHVKGAGVIYTSPKEIIESDTFWDHVKLAARIKTK